MPANFLPPYTPSTSVPKLFKPRDGKPECLQGSGRNPKRVEGDCRQLRRVCDLREGIATHSMQKHKFNVAIPSICSREARFLCEGCQFLNVGN